MNLREQLISTRKSFIIAVGIFLFAAVALLILALIITIAVYINKCFGSLAALLFIVCIAFVSVWRVIYVADKE